jgi:DNA-binding transcriptional LysR family regulator
MKFRQLEIFTAVVETGSFTRASQRLFMAQPAVSIAIKKLEEELKVKLIYRADKLTPTSEGQVLLEHAKELLNGMQKAKQAICDLHTLESGLIRFSTSPIMGEYFFPDKVDAFKHLYPKINFQIFAQETIEERQQLDNQLCDMAIVNMENLPKDMEALALSRQEIVACIYTHNPLAKQKNISLETFLKQPLILYTEKHTLRKLVARASEDLTIKPTIILESDFTGMILKTISRDKGIGLSLRAIANQEPNIKTLPFKKPLFLSLGLGWKKNTYLSAANTAFIHFLKENK